MISTSDSVHTHPSARRLLNKHFRCPEDLIADFVVDGDLSNDVGYFLLDSDIVCYGNCSSGDPSSRLSDTLHNAGDHMVAAEGAVHLSFDPVQVVENLLRERYAIGALGGPKTLARKTMIRNLYYLARPFMRVSIRKHLQKLYFRGWNKVAFPKWPVDITVDKLNEKLMVLSMKSLGLKRVPFVWYWPDGARACAIMTHDVETSSGVDFCPELMDLDDSFGIKGAFQVVPEERYPVSEQYLHNIVDRGFEVNVQDLNHDGLLFSDRDVFLSRVQQINRYGRQFRALGFRAGALYRNADWSNELDFSYDMSTPNVAHLDPQRGGCCTVLPFFLGKILELPVTTIQDYTLFHILNDYSIRLWKEQISRIDKHMGSSALSFTRTMSLTKRRDGSFPSCSNTFLSCVRKAKSQSPFRGKLRSGGGLETT